MVNTDNPLLITLLNLNYINCFLLLDTARSVNEKSKTALPFIAYHCLTLENVRNKSLLAMGLFCLFIYLSINVSFFLLLMGHLVEPDSDPGY